MSASVFAYGAGWGLAGGLTVALLLAIWMIHALIGLLRKQPAPPAHDDSVTTLQTRRA